jgi:hypothetical protein
MFANETYDQEERDRLVVRIADNRLDRSYIERHGASLILYSDTSVTVAQLHLYPNVHIVGLFDEFFSTAIDGRCQFDENDVAAF